MVTLRLPIAWKAGRLRIMKVIKALLAISVLFSIGCAPPGGGQSGSDLGCLPGDCEGVDAGAGPVDLDCGGLGGSEMGCPECADSTSSEVHYVGESAQACFTILFTCEPWQEMFSDPCGCGCLGPAEEPETVLSCGGLAGSDMGCPECADPTSPHVQYIGESVQACFTLLFSCEDGQEQFFDDCGCGCIDPYGE